jgi:hypothetical protein
LLLLVIARFLVLLVRELTSGSHNDVLGAQAIRGARLDARDCKTSALHGLARITFKAVALGTG